MWELTVADEARLCGMERCMIRMMCEVRLIDRVLTDVLWDRVGVVVKIEDIIQSHCGSIVMSCMETLIPKYFRLCKLK